MEQQPEQLAEEFLTLIEKVFKDELFFKEGAAPIFALCKEKMKDFKAVVIERLKKKKISYIRHAQSTYNAWKKKSILNLLGTYKNSISNYDPPITDLGKEQCKTLLTLLDSKPREKIELVMVSPMRRAIQTFMNVKEAVHLRDCKNVILTPLLVERKHTPADIGTPTSDLKQLFPNVDYEFLIKENWWNWHSNDYDLDNRLEKSIRKETTELVIERIVLLLIWIAFRKENTILLVGHSSYYDRYIQKMKIFTTHIKNAELKNFDPAHVTKFVTKFLKV